MANYHKEPMTLAQVRLLTKLLIHGSFEVSTMANTAKVCERMGWTVITGLMNRHTLTDVGRAALKANFPEIVELYDEWDRLNSRAIESAIGKDD